LEYRIDKAPEGWYVLRAGAEDASGERIAGPFHTRGQACDFIVEIGRAQAQEEQQSAAEIRARLISDDAIIQALTCVSRLPVKLRGRPHAERSRKCQVAVEYYWRVRQGMKPTFVISAIAQEFACTPDFVRKCRDEYKPVAAYDSDLLVHLRCGYLAPETKAPTDTTVRSTSRRAQEFLKTVLAKDAVSAAKVYRASAKAGFSKRTIDRAKKALAIETAREGGRRTWRLPRLPNS
jgi:hypothetical protein